MFFSPVYQFPKLTQACPEPTEQEALPILMGWSLLLLLSLRCTLWGAHWGSRMHSTRWVAWIKSAFLPPNHLLWALLQWMIWDLTIIPPCAVCEAQTIDTRAYQNDLCTQLSSLSSSLLQTGTGLALNPPSGDSRENEQGSAHPHTWHRLPIVTLLSPQGWWGEMVIVMEYGHNP